MSIAASAIAEEAIAAEVTAQAGQRTPAKRRMIAKADAVPAPEPR